jgi:hypothetical protein
MKSEEQVAELFAEIQRWPMWSNEDAASALAALEGNCAALGVDINATGGAIMLATRESFDELIVAVEAQFKRSDLNLREEIADAEGAVRSWVYAMLVSYLAGVLHGRELGSDGKLGAVQPDN